MWEKRRRRPKYGAPPGARRRNEGKFMTARAHVSGCALIYGQAGRRRSRRRPPPLGGCVRRQIRKTEQTQKRFLRRGSGAFTPPKKCSVIFSGLHASPQPAAPETKNQKKLPPPYLSPGSRGRNWDLRPRPIRTRGRRLRAAWSQTFPFRDGFAPPHSN